MIAAFERTIPRDLQVILDVEPTIARDPPSIRRIERVDASRTREILRVQR